jgi:hypothetical protein
MIFINRVNRVKKAQGLGSGFLVKAVTLCCGLIPGSHALAKSVVVKGNPQSESGSLVEKWMAVGSGCQATSDKPGDVKFVGAELSKNDPKGSLSVASVKFDLSQFNLRPLVQKESAQGDTQSQPAKNDQSSALKSGAPESSLMNYARECAIRIVVSPPPGTKLRSVSAKAVAEISKDRNSKLFLQGALKTGASTVAKSVHRFGSDQDFRFRSEVMEMVPGRNPDDEIAPVSCNEKKIVGLDLTLLTNKDSPAAVAEAKLAANSIVDVDLEFENCETAP